MPRPETASAPPLLELVVDAGPGVGAGHLGRCLALVESWHHARGRAVLRDGPACPEPWAQRYEAAGAEVGGEIGSGAAPSAGRVVVVDGYRTPTDAVATWRASAPIVSIDDHGTSGPRPADLVVDQNLGADPRRYTIGPERPAVLSGPRYALLRRDVVAAAPVDGPDRSRPVERLLVAPGGQPESAVRDLLLRAGRAVADRRGLELVELRGAHDVGAELARADLVLSAAGSTVWELLLHGLPAVVVAVADNQAPVARAVGSSGVAVDAGNVGDLDVTALAARLDDLAADRERRADLCRGGRALVDGLGARRVASAARARVVRLAPAGDDDVVVLWEWANDPETRRWSFAPDPIGWDAHVAWYDRIRSAPDARLWVARDDQGRRLGQVRVEHASTGTGVVDVSVAPDRRGEGWAAPLIVAAAERAEDELAGLGLEVLRAQVLDGNDRSASAFVAADFDRSGDGLHGGRQHRTYHRSQHG